MERLKELRNMHGLNQQQLGKLINVSRNTVSQYETGDREPTFKTLIFLADYFSTTTDYLLGREPHQSKEQNQFLNFSKHQLELVEKIKALTDTQCLTLCNMLDTLTTEQQTTLDTYKKLKKYED